MKKNTNKHKKTKLCLLLLSASVLITLAACKPEPAQTVLNEQPCQSRTVAAPVEIQPTAASSEPTIEPGELTFEENMRMNPPPPQELTLEAQERGICLVWSAGPTPETEHLYGDMPLYYKVFRRSAAESEPVFLAQIADTFYLDAAASPGNVYYYVVVGVYSNLAGSVIDGARSEEASITY